MRPKSPTTTTCGVSHVPTKLSAVNVTVALSSPTVVFFGSKNSHTCRMPAAVNTAPPSGVGAVRLQTNWHPWQPPAYHPCSSTGHTTASAYESNHPKRTEPGSALSVEIAIASPPAESPVARTPQWLLTAAPAGTTCPGSTCAVRCAARRSRRARTVRSTWTTRSSKYAALTTNPSAPASGNRAPTVSLRGVKKTQISAAASGPMRPVDAAVAVEPFGLSEQAVSPAHAPPASQQGSGSADTSRRGYRLREPGSTLSEARRTCSSPTVAPDADTVMRTHCASPLHATGSGANAAAVNNPCTTTPGTTTSTANPVPVTTTDMFNTPTVVFSGVNHRYTLRASPDTVATSQTRYPVPVPLAQ
ncbi:hypothetical protein DIPPA_17240 [Diplonema papillatum]|nr:hypothetical protein DIPPA_17240 [Diplonema papillatum]